MILLWTTQQKRNCAELLTSKNPYVISSLSHEQHQQQLNLHVLFFSITTAYHHH